MHEIRVGVRKERVNIHGNTDTWDEGLPANHDQLKAELTALAIPGVRGYTVFGREGAPGGYDEVVGVYPWSDKAPVGEYRHLDEVGFEVKLTAAQVARIEQAIRAHIPKVKPHPNAALIKDVEDDALMNATTKKALLAMLKATR